MYLMCAWCLQRPEKCIWSTDGCVPPRGYWESKLCPLGKQPVHLTSALFLQPQPQEVLRQGSWSCSSWFCGSNGRTGEVTAPGRHGVPGAACSLLRLCSVPVLWFSFSCLFIYLRQSFPCSPGCFRACSVDQPDQPAGLGLCLLLPPEWNAGPPILTFSFLRITEAWLTTLCRSQPPVILILFSLENGYLSSLPVKS